MSSVSFNTDKGSRIELELDYHRTGVRVSTDGKTSHDAFLEGNKVTWSDSKTIGYSRGIKTTGFTAFVPAESLEEVKTLFAEADANMKAAEAEWANLV